MRSKKSRKKITVFLFAIIVLLSNFYLIYNISLLNGIENIGRYLIISLLSLIDLFVLTELFNIIKSKKRSCGSYYVFVVLTSIYLIINVVGSVAINKVYFSINKVNRDYEVYSSSIVTLTKNSSTIDDIKTFGMISDKTSIAGYQISNSIIEKEKINNSKIKSYNSYPDLLNALYKKEIEAIFIDTGYVSMFETMDEFKNINNETKIIYSKEQKVKKENEVKKDILEPFTVLVMGVDSTANGISSNASNGDTLILLTFNPNTLSTTMLSIPRDSYVPISCFTNQKKNKITHAAWGGAECMINTISNFLDVEIDYYVKINFKGVVSLVDALGGITVDVPYNFCEQNSNRKWAENTVYVEKGIQNLNGEQALALARNRHPNRAYCSAKWLNYTSDDFVRNQNQQKIIKAVIEKLKGINSVNKINNVLNAISNNLDTSFTTDQILSFYNIFKDTFVNRDNSVNIEQLILKGYGAMIYEESFGMELWSYVLYDKSVADVKTAMKVNLEKEKPNEIKTFDYSPTNPYVFKKPGEI